MIKLTATVFKIGKSTALRLPRELNVRAKAYEVTPTASGFLFTVPQVDDRRSKASRLKALRALCGSVPDFPDHTS